VLILLTVRNDLAVVRQPHLGVDIEIPLRAADRWLTGGPPYEAHAFITGSGATLPFLYPPVVLPLFAASLLMLTLTALFWPIKAVLRWRYSQPMALGRRDMMLYRLTRVVAWIYVATFAGWAWFLVSAQLSLAVFDSPSDPLIRLLQLLSIIAIAGTIIPILEFWAALRDRQRPWWTKETDGLIVVACVYWPRLISYNFITASPNY
jgi:hypothetical protein